MSELLRLRAARVKPERVVWRNRRRLTEAERQELRDRARVGDLDACAALARNALQEVARLETLTRARDCELHA